MVFFIFNQLFCEQTASDLVLYCLLMSHKKDPRLIWVKTLSVSKIILYYFFVSITPLSSLFIE